jgi:hypothetical protein
MSHFLFSTGWGSLVMVLVASAGIGLVLWDAVAFTVTLMALALWRLSRRRRPSA